VKHRMMFLSPCILFACLIPQPCQPCTSFCLDHGNQLVFGSNLDWYLDDGLVIVNKRGVSKTAMTYINMDSNPTSWTSKYGSLTFNQYGREITFSGINEAGLVVSTMMLLETEYPAPDSRPSLGPGQWTQYQLDNSSTVKEVIASHSQFRMKPAPGIPGGHYLVCDRTGTCAVIEFIGGKLVYHTDETMPVKTLTNSTYEDSIQYWKQGKLPIPDEYNSIDRFVRASNMIKKYGSKTSKPAVDYAFDTLAHVAAGEVEEIDGQRIRSFGGTEWSIVYDIKNLHIYFRTFENQNIRHINLNSFDFFCKTPVKVLDINATLSEDVTNKFTDYTRQINRNLIGSSYRKTLFLRNYPDDLLDAISRYPETTTCMNK